MSWKAQINERGVVTRYKDIDTGEVVSVAEYERRTQMQMGGYSSAGYANGGGSLVSAPVASSGYPSGAPGAYYPSTYGNQGSAGVPLSASVPAAGPGQYSAPGGQTAMSDPAPVSSPLIQPGAQILGPGASSSPTSTPVLGGQTEPSQTVPIPVGPGRGVTPTAGQPIQGKNLRLEGMPQHIDMTAPQPYKAKGFLDTTSVAILLPTLVLLALIIAAAHKKRLFPWQTIRTFNPPSGLLTPLDYQKSFLCPPNLRRHGRLGKRNPNATWTDADGVVVPFGFLARTHLPITIPIGRLPNKNMFIVAPSGSGKTTLMRAIIKALLAKPCVIIALEAKANDPNLDEKKEGFKYSVLPEAQLAGFDSLYFNPLDKESVHWNPLDAPPIVFASSVVQDVNSLEPEDQHWAERDHGYIAGLAQLLKWGAVQIAGEDENGVASKVEPLQCNPYGLMRLVNNRRNIVESLRRLKLNPDVPGAQLTELTQTLSSIIRTDTDWDKNIQGVRGRLRMFNNKDVLEVTQSSNIDLKASMHRPTVLIFGAPASLGPDAESMASCFVYQLQQALHTRYGTASVLPLFAFFDEYQTLNMDIAGRLSAIVRGANGGLAIILQNISQITDSDATGGTTKSGASELKTIFSNSSVRVCLHNADETTAKFFSEEIGKHAVVVPGVADHYMAGGFGIFPSSWNRIHSQQVVQRVDPDAIKRMEKHHALVYLSPAGDPEFGENKPLMVDLRGIEEIARLHLLHNVTNRKTPPGTIPPGAAPIDPSGPSGFPPNGGANPQSPHGAGAGPFGSVPQNLPQGPAPHPGMMPAGFSPAPFGQALYALAANLEGQIQSRGQAVLPGQTTQNAIPVVDRVCTKCGHTGGNRKFCIQCGAFLGQSGQGVSGAQPAQYDAAAAQGSVPYQQSSGQMPNYANPQMPNYPVAQQSYTQPQGATNAHVVPTYSQPAINHVEGTPAAVAPRRAPLFDGPLQIAEAAQQAYTGKRSPLRSLDVDVNSLGIPGTGPNKSGRP
jgi:type IV secretory pathway TraG/TraD family ATPase VirD4